MYLLYASKEVLILRINFVIVIVIVTTWNCQTWLIAPPRLGRGGEEGHIDSNQYSDLWS